MFRMFLFLLIICNTAVLLSQKNYSEIKAKYYENKWNKLDNKNINPRNINQSLKAQLGLSDDDKLVLNRQVDTKGGQKHYKYKHFYKNIRVVGSNCSFHEFQNVVTKSSGSLFPFIDVEVTPTISYDRALSLLYDQLVHSMQRLDYLIKIDDIDCTYDNLGTVIIDKDYPNISGDYRLAYHVLLSSTSDDIPLSEDVYIDAETGELINHFSRIHLHNVPGVVKTKYYGLQDVTVDSIAPNEFLLQDLSRGQGVVTLDEDLDIYHNDSSYWDLENENQDEIAADLHYCSTAFYDMMLDKFGWDGIDDEGGQLVGSTHAGGKFLVNAYWDGVRARFGNGDCDRYTPLTTLDIVGHEFAHGITDYTSDLIYRAESGALNESMSDIFGKALEYFYDRQNFNWLVGDRIRRNGDINVIRSMEDPFLRSDPKYYKGTNWYFGSGDNYGVHTNSGVLNYWFYLLVNGGAITNEVGEFYNIQPIGMEDAIQVTFQMQAAYLTENSNYYDAVNASLESASDLFGPNSFQREIVERTWNAVGLYATDNRTRLELVLETDFITACPGDIVYPEFIIYNIGQEVLKANTELIVNFKSNNGVDNFNESITLIGDLEVGDSLKVLLNTPITNAIENNGQFNLGIALDQNPNIVINEVVGKFATSEINGLDIVLDNAEIYKRQECESGDVDGFRYRIINQGCQTIFTDDTITFNISTNAGSFKADIKMFFDFEPGDITTSSRTLSFLTPDVIPQGIETFTVDLMYEDDLNLANNSFDGKVSKRGFISNGYRESFSVKKDNPEYELVSNSFYNEDTIVALRGNEMLAIFGERDHTFLRNCENSDDFFNEYFFKTDVEFCIDARDMEAPIFEFNLMTFNHEMRLVDLANEDHATMVQVSYENGEEDIIYGQKEGALINHKIALPVDYVGEFTIAVLTVAQDEILLNKSFLEKKDVALLDDFKLYDKMSHSNLITYDGFSINPNPTSSIIRIGHEDNNQVFDVKIHDPVGQIVFSKSNITNQDWVDVSEFVEGVYFISFYSDGNFISTGRFVKATN